MELEMGSLCSWQCPYFWDAQLRPEVWLADGFCQCWECLRQASEDEAGRLWPLWTTKAWVHHRCLMHAWGREGGRNAQLQGQLQSAVTFGDWQFPSSHCHSTEWWGAVQLRTMSWVVSLSNISPQSIREPWERKQSTSAQSNMIATSPM